MLAASFQHFSTTPFMGAASSNARPCLHEERRNHTLQKKTGVLGIAAAQQDTVTPGRSERGQCLRREGCKRLRVVTAAASAASTPAAADPAASAVARGGAHHGAHGLSGERIVIGVRARRLRPLELAAAAAGGRGAAAAAVRVQHVAGLHVAQAGRQLRRAGLLRQLRA